MRTLTKARAWWRTAGPVTAVALVAAACDEKRLPPPAIPAASVPEFEHESSAPEPGFARVNITSDVPAHVATLARATRHYRGRNSDSTEMLCERTPCAVTLPYGDHELVFAGVDDAARTSVVVLHVARASVVLNHTLGRNYSPPGQEAAIAIGAIGAVTALVAAGVAIRQDRENQNNDGALDVAAVGAGAFVLGGVLGALNPTQLQDGSSRQWTPDEAVAKPPPQPLGFHF